MMIELSVLATDLAQEYEVPPLFMVERLSDLIRELGERPSLYSIHTGRFTSSGAEVARTAFSIAHRSGRLERQLTAWSAQ